VKLPGCVLYCTVLYLKVMDPCVGDTGVAVHFRLEAGDDAGLLALILPNAGIAGAPVMKALLSVA
jgi:hypothetical protein